MDASGMEFLLEYASWAEVPPGVGTLGRTRGVFISFTYIFCPYGTLNQTELSFFSTRLIGLMGREGVFREGGGWRWNLILIFSNQW
jgi:hypothetical protein